MPVVKLAKWKRKDPADIADYWFDWGSDLVPASERFLPADEDITGYTLTVPAGLTLVDDDNTDKTVRLRLSGGMAGTRYPIDCEISTTAGQVFEQTKELLVEERYAE